ncbi:MAG: outer membrane protein assembly factor BamB [Porticoccus sp.]
MKRLSWLLVPLLLTGCGVMEDMVSSVTDSGPEFKPTVLVDFEHEVQALKLWSTNAVGDYRSESSGLRPGLGEGAVFVADSKGGVAAIDTSTGKITWKVELNSSLGGGVGIGEDLVMVGSINGDVFALEAATGEQRWHTMVSSEVLAAPVGNGDVVVVQTQDGRVIGLNAADGEKRWQFKLDVPVLTLRGTSAPIIKGNTVVTGFANGKVYALSADSGTMIWDNRIAIPQGRTELERLVDIDGQPLLANDIVYAVSYQGRVGAMARGTGRELWYQDSSSIHGLAYGLEQVYVAETDDTVKAMRASSGQILWTNDQLSHRLLNRPSVSSGYVAVADAEGYLHILSQTDGRFVGRTRVHSSGVSAPMVSDGGVLYVLDDSGGVSAYKFE